MTMQELVKYIQIEENSRNLDRLELEDNKSSKALVMDHGSSSGSKHKLDGQGSASDNGKDKPKKACTHKILEGFTDAEYGTFDRSIYRLPPWQRCPPPVRRNSSPINNPLPNRKIYVIKRNGRQEPVHFDKITARLKKLSYGLSAEHCDPVLPAQKVCAGVYKGVTTTQLDELAAETAAAMTTHHPDYALLAARIAVSNLHKKTKKLFSETIRVMYSYYNKRSGQKASLVADGVYEIIMKNAARLDSEIIYDRDFDYDFFGFKTLERSYLLKVDGDVVEKPQHMLMRVAVGIHKDDIDSALTAYHLMSQRWFTHASSTLFNAGTPRPQLSSCFLVCMKDDSIDGIYDTLKECAVISKSAGGIGVSALNIRATGSAFAIYLEPWHADIFEFLDLRKNHGKERHRARDLFYALWVPDLFMERVQSDKQWSLFCPNKAPGLADCWGEEFEKLYSRYEEEGRAKKFLSARKLWFEILNSQTETGTPYMLFKDTCNRKSNQQNLGTIKSSNLCSEIIEAQLKLQFVTAMVTKNLNKIIDVNHYPVENARRSNLQHRPIGVGVQGLADTFILLGMAFDSPEGILQVDMWGVTPSDRWDWAVLREKISKNGVRNFLHIAPMPTASTSQILGNNECFEPYTSNIYSRRVLSGEFVVVNKHLLHDLSEMGLWSPALKDNIVYNNGSVSKIPEIPEELKAIYKYG
ncbi:hypothetical protein RJ639_004744 [Escallonia herrerae]|uniref:Ribonucleoside-diphosphate reductase n=1 Tax=Escallonia herrerae TaxID=1293975 RepID=A0AA88W1A6_9ASTE|nr:hypothetical protein RJ639_004744 [Escallonia herrerae]